MTLPDDVIKPWHAIQLTTGQYVVCHGDGDDDDDDDDDNDDCYNDDNDDVDDRDYHGYYHDGDGDYETTIQLTTGQYVVCHGGVNDAVHRVCVMSAECTRIVHSHGGQCGSDIGQYDVPYHLAVDDNEFVFVADPNNQRVTLLSPTLNYTRQVVSRDKLKWRPCCLHLDVQRRRLYVADNEVKDDWTAGRVVVFSV